MSKFLGKITYVTMPDTETPMKCKRCLHGAHEPGRCNTPSELGCNEPQCRRKLIAVFGKPDPIVIDRYSDATFRYDEEAWEAVQFADEVLCFLKNKEGEWDGDYLLVKRPPEFQSYRLVP